jgi:drug/metabolite transporter superfamily protein YnfA
MRPSIWGTLGYGAWFALLVTVNIRFVFTPDLPLLDTFSLFCGVFAAFGGVFVISGRAARSVG